MPTNKQSVLYAGGRSNQRGYAHVLVISLIVVLSVVALSGYLVVQRRAAADELQADKLRSVTSFEICRQDRSNALIQSVPQKCVTADGRVFTEQPPTEQPSAAPVR